MMTTDPVRILMVSDIHFGHHSNDQEEMAEAFVKTIFPMIPDLDLLCINGDLFDSLVNFDSSVFDPIYNTILGLFYLCETHQVKLRVLQGTWTHDRNQCKRLVTFYKNYRATFDFKFIDGIEFETISMGHREIRFLYVKDDLPYKSSEAVLEVINEKRRELGWEYVDYACMHGFFDFTFPKNVRQDNVVVFKEEQFDFVRKAIDVGHVHQHRINGKAISNGSFDRLNFGDEDPKGCMLILDYPDYCTAKFIENKFAAVYDSIQILPEDDTETMCAKINKHLSALTTTRKISLRFLVNSTEQFHAITTWMREAHPEVRISSKREKDKDEEMIPMVSSLMVPVEREIPPTLETLPVFIRNNIPESFELSLEKIRHHLGLDQ